MRDRTAENDDSSWAWVFFVLLLMAGFGPVLFWIAVPLAIIFGLVKLGKRASRWLTRPETAPATNIEAEPVLPIGVCVIVGALLLLMFGGPVLLAVLR